eukprot:6488893-Amphidinium_carterae.1
MLLVTLTLLVLVEVEDVNVKLVLEVLIKIGVEAVIKVHDEVELDGELVLLERKHAAGSSLVPVEVDKVNVNLVREVLMEVDIEVDDVPENIIGVVVVLPVDKVQTEHLSLLQLVDVLDDADTNRKVAVEVDVEVDLLGVSENRLVDVEMLLMTLSLPVLIEVDVEVVDVHKNTIDGVEVLVVGTVLAEHLTLLLLVDELDDVDASRKVAVEVDIEVDLLGVAENRLVDVEMLLVTLALPVLVDVEEVNVSLVLEVL